MRLAFGCASWMNAGDWVRLSAEALPEDRQDMWRPLLGLLRQLTYSRVRWVHTGCCFRCQKANPCLLARKPVFVRGKVRLGVVLLLGAVLVSIRKLFANIRCSVQIGCEP